MPSDPPPPRVPLFVLQLRALGSSTCRLVPFLLLSSFPSLLPTHPSIRLPFLVPSFPFVWRRHVGNRPTPTPTRRPKKKTKTTKEGDGDGRRRRRSGGGGGGGGGGRRRRFGEVGRGLDGVSWGARRAPSAPTRGIAMDARAARPRRVRRDPRRRHGIGKDRAGGGVASRVEATRRRDEEEGGEEDEEVAGGVSADAGARVEARTARVVRIEPSRPNRARRPRRPRGRGSGRGAGDVRAGASKLARRRGRDVPVRRPASHDVGVRGAGRRTSGAQSRRTDHLGVQVAAHAPSLGAHRFAHPKPPGGTVVRDGFRVSWTVGNPAGVRRALRRSHTHRRVRQRHVRRRRRRLPMRRGAQRCRGAVSPASDQSGSEHPTAPTQGDRAVLQAHPKAESAVSRVPFLRSVRSHPRTQGERPGGIGRPAQDMQPPGAVRMRRCPRTFHAAVRTSRRPRRNRSVRVPRVSVPARCESRFGGERRTPCQRQDGRPDGIATMLAAQQAQGARFHPDPADVGPRAEGGETGRMETPSYGRMHAHPGSPGLGRCVPSTTGRGRLPADHARGWTGAVFGGRGSGGAGGSRLEPCHRCTSGREGLENRTETRRGDREVGHRWYRGRENLPQADPQADAYGARVA
mmetsp:Transcript_10401/g.63468  ORF Transcript_10401/g.63468 Transcript_10401/m.63468 type:complete len:631 (-) Transcript_10401:715-2607(-)